MPEVSVVVELRVVVEDAADPVALERAVAAEGRRASRELYRGCLKAIDEKAVAASGGARQRLEERWVATTFGRVRIWRYRVKAGGGSICPLDRAIGLGQAEASRLTGEPLSHLSCWRILLAEGARVRAEDGRLAASVFELGEAPPDDVPSPELVVVEADGTFLKAQHELSDRFEVKTGVFYTGKEPAGGRRHRRWRLVNKGCYATTADADRFGMGLAAAGFHWGRPSQGELGAGLPRRAGRVR